MENNVQKKQFKDIDFTVSFFDSLREDYVGFNDWTKKKSNEECFVIYTNSIITGFLYLKKENEPLETETKQLPQKLRLKIGTFKIEAHGTKLGERFLKIAFDKIVSENIEEAYVTIFPKHTPLIQLFESYGFQFASYKKKTASGKEAIYIKNIKEVHHNILKDYPLISIKNNKKYLLSIYPKYHTSMFPDSKLTTEKDHIVQDISHTNSIHKVYICRMKNIEHIKKGDILVIYRTKEENKSAKYNSVITSICTVEEYKNIKEYNTFDEFEKDISKYSVFKKQELIEFYNTKRYPHIIKMVYNIALPKRIIRKDGIPLLDPNNTAYWGFLPIEDTTFVKLLKMGEVNENFIIN